AMLPMVASVFTSLLSLTNRSQAPEIVETRFAGDGGLHDVPPMPLIWLAVSLAFVCADDFAAPIAMATPTPPGTRIPPTTTGATFDGGDKRPLCEDEGGSFGVSGFGVVSAGGAAGTAAGAGDAVMANRAPAVSPARTVTLFVAVVPTVPLNFTVCALGST